MGDNGVEEVIIMGDKSVMNGLRGNVTKYLGQSERVTNMYDSHKNSFFFFEKGVPNKKNLKNLKKLCLIKSGPFE